MDNQEVMDRMVDLEQEVLRLKDINSDLEDLVKADTFEILELKAELLKSMDLRYELTVENRELKEKSKAWDDLEALLKSDKDMVSLGFAKYEGEPLVKYNGVFYGCSTIAEGVSNALESIKWES